MKVGITSSLDTVSMSALGLRNSIRSPAFRFLRQPSRPNAPRPVAKLQLIMLMATAHRVEAVFLQFRVPILSGRYGSVTAATRVAVTGYKLCVFASRDVHVRFGSKADIRTVRQFHPISIRKP